METNKRRKNSPLLFILELVLIAVFLFSMGKLAYTLWQYRQSATGYEAIRSEIRTDAPAQSSQPQESGMQEGVDFSKLQQQYPQAVAWLHGEGTPIDYPVMQAGNNDYFLRRLPDGTWNLGGSLFLDYRSASDFSGALSLIYGHNMKDGSMFSCLENYTEQSWYDEHPALTLQTPQGLFSLQVLYGFSIAAQDWVDRGFDQAGSCAQMAEYAAAHSTFTSAAQWDGSAPLVALLTCTTNDDQSRYVLVCQLAEQPSSN